MEKAVESRLRQHLDSGSPIQIHVLSDEPWRFTLARVIDVDDNWVKFHVLDNFANADGVRYLRADSIYRLEWATEHCNMSETMPAYKELATKSKDLGPPLGIDWLSQLCDARLVVELARNGDLEVARLRQHCDTHLCIDQINSELLSFDGLALIDLEEIDYVWCWSRRCERISECISSQTLSRH